MAKLVGSGDLPNIWSGSHRLAPLALLSRREREGQG